jgi:tripartite-type tricarboxylate transporter receptor subunit TctC
VVIDNKPGAGGVLGSDAVAKSAADGYTMIVGNAGSHGVNAGIYSKLPYDVVKDFVPVAMICTTPNVMVVSPNTKAKTVAEFIALAKANPGKFNYASGGVGSSAHLSAELFKSMTSTDITHIPYKGSSPAVAGRIAIDDWQFAPVVGTDQSRQDPGFGRHHGQAPPQPARCARLGRGLAGF